MAAHGMAPPENTLPMMTGEGPFGPIDMGGMFTVVKSAGTSPPATTRPRLVRPPGRHRGLQGRRHRPPGLISPQLEEKDMRNPGRAMLAALAVTLASGAAWAAGTPRAATTASASQAQESKVTRMVR